MRRRIGGLLTVALALFAAAAVAAARSPQQEALASQSMLQQTAAAIERGDLAAASRIAEPALKAHPADPVLHNLALQRIRRPTRTLAVSTRSTQRRSRR